MSMATGAETESSTSCGYCSGSWDTGRGVRGSYCSWPCYYRDRGEGIINRLDSDRRICSTCYGHVRQTVPFPEGQRGPGIQFSTERTVIGIDGFGPPFVDDSDENEDPLDVAYPLPWHDQERHEEVEGTRWSCVCGAVDPQETHDVLQNTDYQRTITNFYRALIFLFEHEALPHEPDLVSWLESLSKHPHDARYAAGLAVYG